MKYRTTSEKQKGTGYSGKVRESNLEILRIIAMLSIIAHHFVVNSGIQSMYDYSNITCNMVFLQLWGMWGKTAINVFVLITGYFMCTSKLTWQRFSKMYFQAKFYKIIFFLIFVFAGYQTITAKSLFMLLFGYLYSAGNGFTGSFFAFYLFIPFLNALIEKLDKAGLQKLLMLMLLYFTVASTFFFNSSFFCEPFWYMTLYCLAAYIRLYPNQWTESRKVAGIWLIVSVCLAYASVLIVDFVGMRIGFSSFYHMVADSNKLLAVAVGVSIFLFFKNSKIKYSKFINAVASTTFGVLLIHANSNEMRQWLWKDLLKLNLKVYYKDWIYAADTEMI